MKKFLANPDASVGMLGAANLLFAGFEKVASKMGPFLTAILTLAQIAVAGVTFYYIWRKARAVKVPTPRKRKLK